MHLPHRGPQAVGQVHVGAADEDGAGAAGQPAGRLAHQIGDLRAREVRTEAVEQVERAQVRGDDVVERRAWVLGAVDHACLAGASQAERAAPHEERQLQPGRRERRE